MLETWGLSLLPPKSLGTDSHCITGSPCSYYCQAPGLLCGVLHRGEATGRDRKAGEGEERSRGLTPHPCARSHWGWCWGGTRGLPGRCPGQTGHGLLLQQGMSAEKAILPASSWERLETL